jgi:hypothetical protein
MVDDYEAMFADILNGVPAPTGVPPSGRVDDPPLAERP